MSDPITEKKHPSRRPLTRCRRGASAFKKPRRGSHLPRPDFGGKLHKTALVDVYAKSGELASARHLFDTMPEKSLVSLTAMITCYAKHGDVDEARLLFNGLKEKDAVCWNVMIDGYAQNGRPNEALVMFRQMLKAKAKPNEATLVAILSACGQLGALELGRWVHSYIENSRIRFNARVGTALVDMYSKCGSLDDARIVFNLIEDKDVVAWNSMINGYSIHGFTKDALTLFDTMRQKGLRPTDITFIAVLSASAHAGLVSDGWRIFNLMNDEYGIEPKIEHYGCMVNLLGRAGHVDEAYELIQSMKMEPDPVLWGTLLGACRLHGNIELGESMAKYLVGQNLANSGTYVLLFNVKAKALELSGFKNRWRAENLGSIGLSGFAKFEIMNKKMCVTDLNIDVLRHIMLFVARSPDGALCFGRALSVCKSFRELEKDTEILKCVAFGEQSAKDSHQSFWGLNGLLTRCALAKNADARPILTKYLEAQAEVWRQKRFVVEKAAKVARKKHKALVAANTRERKRGFELAQKEYEELFVVSQKERRQLMDHVRALLAQIPKDV